MLCDVLQEQIWIIFREHASSEHTLKNIWSQFGDESLEDITWLIPATYKVLLLVHAVNNATMTPL